MDLFVILIIIAVAISLGGYVFQQKTSPTTSYAEVRVRIRRYYLGTFSLWMLIVGGLFTIGYIEGINQDRQDCIVSENPLCMQQLEETIMLDFVLQFAIVAVLALIPTLIVYAVLQVYHSNSDYGKPKRKSKNDHAFFE